MFTRLMGSTDFIIRHGHTFIRTAKVEQQKTEMLHYRPEKDDVVVYSPELDEIRIHAGTKGERELYRKQFGQRLFGDDELLFAAEGVQPGAAAGRRERTPWTLRALAGTWSWRSCASMRSLSITGLRRS